MGAVVSACELYEHAVRAPREECFYEALAFNPSFGKKKCLTRPGEQFCTFTSI